MVREADKFKIGLFVIVSIAIFAALVIWLGASKYLKPYNYYVTYFDESISGLDIGSPVSFRGVPVGAVSEVRIAPDGTLLEIRLKIDVAQKIPENYYAMLELKGITGQR